jgi:hypothetical protein
MPGTKNMTLNKPDRDVSSQESQHQDSQRKTQNSIHLKGIFGKELTECGFTGRQQNITPNL